MRLNSSSEISKKNEVAVFNEVLFKKKRQFYCLPTDCFAEPMVGNFKKGGEENNKK